MGDLSKAATDGTQGWSIEDRMMIARRPLAWDLEEIGIDGTPVRGRAAGGFFEQQRNAVLIGGTGTSRTAIAVARARIRHGARRRLCRPGGRQILHRPVERSARPCRTEAPATAR